MSANGSMLRLARQRKQLSQIDAAVKLGIEQPILSRAENGLIEVREDLLMRASAFILCGGAKPLFLGARWIQLSRN